MHNASLQALQPDRTHVTSCRNIVRWTMQLVLLWLIFQAALCVWKGILVKNTRLHCIYKLFNKKIVSVLLKISASGLFFKYS